LAGATGLDLETWDSANLRRNSPFRRRECLTGRNVPDEEGLVSLCSEA